MALVEMPAIFLSGPQITHCLSYGEFAWCCNGDESGYYLSLVKDRTYPQKKLLLCIKIVMSRALLNATDRIELYDATGFLASYNTKPITTTNYSACLKIDTSLQKTTMQVLFRKFLPIPTGASPFARTPMETVFKTSFVIQSMTLSGDSTCSICLEEPTDDAKYVTPCGHVFHMSCIYDYLHAKEFIRPMPELCSKYCCSHGSGHSPKPGPFACPVCRRTVSVGVL